MEKEVQDAQEVQETPEEGSTEEVDTELTPEELEDLKRRADASSKNFERLKKEEERRKELEIELEKLQAQQAISGSLEEEDDDDVRTEIKALSAKLRQLEEEKSWDVILSKYPAIKDKRSDFDEYREDYKGIPLEKLAKLFVVENGLDESPQKRKGLEKAGGGTRTIPTSGKMSAEDVARLRQTNYKEYRRLLLAGKIKM